MLNRVDTKSIVMITFIQFWQKKQPKKDVNLYLILTEKWFFRLDQKILTVAESALIYQA